MVRWFPLVAVGLVAALVAWLLSRGDAAPPAGDERRKEAPEGRALGATPPEVPALAGAGGDGPPSAPPADAAPSPKAAGPPVTLRVLRRGVPVVPERYAIRAGDDAFLFLRDHRTGPVEEDRERGLVRFRMPHPVEGEALDVWFHAEEAWPSYVIAARSGDGFAADVGLELAAFVIPRVTPDPAHDVHVAVISQETGRHEPAETPPGYHGLLHIRRGDATMLGPLRPGRYVVYDEESGRASEPVDLAAGDPPREVPLHLPGAGVVRGRVVIPETKASLAQVTDVRIRVEGERLVHLAPVVVAPDGAFTVGVPGDRPVTIRPWHPVLVPAPRDGVVVLTEGRDDVTLRMVAVNWCTLRPTPAPEPRPWFPPLRVLRFRGAPDARPAEVHDVTFDGTTLRFGGYPAGDWTLWIDAHGRAPAVLRDVRLREGTTDLGVVALPRGSGVRVRVLWDAHATPPPVIVRADHLGAPAYRRVTEATPDPFVTLTGLGPGRFHVEALDKGATRQSEADVVVDGVSDVEVTLDLR